MDRTYPTWRKSSYSNGEGGQCMEVHSDWRKSSYSNGEGGQCLEVQDGHAAAVPVRDSKNPTGPHLHIPAPAWNTFVTALNRDTFHG